MGDNMFKRVATKNMGLSKIISWQNLPKKITDGDLIFQEEIMNARSKFLAECEAPEDYLNKDSFGSIENSVGGMQLHDKNDDLIFLQN